MIVRSDNFTWTYKPVKYLTFSDRYLKRITHYISFPPGIMSGINGQSLWQTWNVKRWREVGYISYGTNFSHCISSGRWSPIGRCDGTKAAHARFIFTLLEYNTLRGQLAVALRSDCGLRELLRCSIIHLTRGGITVPRTYIPIKNIYFLLWPHFSLETCKT